MDSVEDIQVQSSHVAVFHSEGQIECQELQIHVEQMEWWDWDGEFGYEDVEGQHKSYKKGEV